MNKDNNKIEEILSKTSFRELSHDEREHIWSKIESKNGYHSLSLIKNHTMFKPLIATLILVVGFGATIVTADNSGPGDKLFGLDRAVENVQLNLASKEKKDELRIKFADERVKELDNIAYKSPSMTRPASVDITEITVSSIEADVFKNQTIIKIKYSDNKNFVFNSEAKTRLEVIDAVNADFIGLSKTFIDSKLDFKTEDRDSKKDDDRVKESEDRLSSDQRIRISSGLNLALSLLNGVSTSVTGDDADRLQKITASLNAYLVENNVSVDSNVNLNIKNNNDKNNTRVDLKTEDGKFRVEVKNNGEINTKQNDKDENSDDDKNKSSMNNDSNKNRNDDNDDNDHDDDDDKIKIIVPPIVTTLNSYTLADVQTHNTSINCWTTINGGVYNVTSWIAQHPGGSAAIVSTCGIDASSAFNGQHGGQSRPVTELAAFKIGILK